MFKAGVSDVRVDVQVTEGKNLVNGLSKDDFVVTDENQPQGIVSFSHGEERLNIILLLDISGSMQKYIDEIAQTARESLEHLRPGDRVAIMVFARTSAVHQGFSDNLAETARQIAGAVKVDVGTSTLINSAVMDAAPPLAARGRQHRREVGQRPDHVSGGRGPGRNSARVGVEPRRVDARRVRPGHVLREGVPDEQHRTRREVEPAQAGAHDSGMWLPEAERL